MRGVIISDNVPFSFYMETTDIKKLFNKYYPDGEPLSDLVWNHSSRVAELADKLAAMHPELDIDRRFLYEAALLHDIGVFRTHAPSVLCMGDEPYMRHGIIGAEILNAEGLPAHALVCERHIGVGLTVRDIIEQHLPLPPRDMQPVSLEEKLVCYADNFFSKSHPDRMKTFDDVRNSVARYGVDNVKRFDKLAALFGSKIY